MENELYKQFSDSNGKISASTIEKLIGSWQNVAPAEEVTPYFNIWVKFPILDAVFFARQTLRNSMEWTMVHSIKREIPMDLDMPVPDENTAPKVDFALSSDYFEKESKLFKLFLYDSPTAHAIDIGLRILGQQNALSFKANELRLTIVPECAKFIRNCYNSSESGYANKPGCEPTIFSNKASVSVIRNYENLLVYLPTPPDIDFQLDTIPNSLMSSRNCFEDNEIFCFMGGNDNKKRCITTTEYVYYICRMLNQIRGGDYQNYKALSKFLASKSKKVLRFIYECFDRDEGGFKQNPDDDSQPNLIHTHHALHLLRAMIERNDIKKEDIDWLDLTKVAEFVLRCFETMGFANFPGGIPSACSERAAITSILMIEIMRANEYGKVNGYYKMNFSRLTEIVRGVPEFISSYTDYLKRICFAYPKSFIDSNEYPIQDIVLRTIRKFNWPDKPVTASSARVILSEKHAQEFARAYAIYTLNSMRIYGEKIHDISSPKGKEVVDRLEKIVYKSLAKQFQFEVK